MSKKHPIYPKEMQTFVMECVQNFCYHLQVQHWKVGVAYAVEEKKSDDLARSDVIVGTMDANFRYLTGVLTLYPDTIKYWKKGDKETIEHIVAHECAHLVTQHFFDLTNAAYKDYGESKDAWEQTTETVGRLVEKIVKMEKQLTIKKK